MLIAMGQTLFTHENFRYKNIYNIKFWTKSIQVLKISLIRQNTQDETIHTMIYVSINQ